MSRRLLRLVPVPFIAAGLAWAAAHTACAASLQPSAARQPFIDARNPPTVRSLDAADAAQVDLGHAVFNTPFVPAGTPNAGRRAGLGPLFNAAACDACHNEGAHARGPASDGPAPTGLVIGFEMPAARAVAGELSAPGDPTYGETLETSAIAGLAPEGSVTVRYRRVPGRYPDGRTYALREPEYELSALAYGPLARDTLIEPRLAPALFGVGLLESVIDRPPRFGWQGTSRSIREQTMKAFARDMGLTSGERLRDDCTAAEVACRTISAAEGPEVGAELLEAVVAFQRTLAVPSRESGDSAIGASLFAHVGCARCHEPTLPTRSAGPSGSSPIESIDAYTDLRVHDLGEGLADRDARGRPVASRWRTAPLWGLGYRGRTESFPTYLHDGRARSVEEAILWHRGEADDVRRRFEYLSAAERETLVRWVSTL